MHRLSKAAAAAALIGLIAVAVFIWRHGPSHPAPETLASDPASCDLQTEACGAHLSKGAKGQAARLEGRPRMLAFSSGSCPACERMEPRLEQAMKACHGEADVRRVNVDDDAGEALAATYDVTLLPSLVNIDASGLEVSRLTGVQPEEQIEHAIEEIRAVRCALVEKPASEKPM